MTKNESVDAASMHPIVHTPGPWVWKHYDNLDCYKLVAIGDYGFHPNGDKVEPQIHSDGSACGEYGADIDVHGPDAKLIAAAPDMLQALIGLVVWSKRSNGTSKEVVDKAKSAIEKATGQPWQKVV
jgi:hypothetical protein